MIPEALDHVMGAHPVAETSVDLIDHVRAHVKCYAIRTAHDFVSSLASIALNPYGFSFSGFKTWKNTGHVILATIAAPASVIRRLSEAEGAGAFKAKSDEELWTYLVKNELVPDSPAGRFVIETAKIVRSSLKPTIRQTFTRHRGTFLRFVATKTSHAAKLCRGHMKDEGLARQEFLEHRIGLTASEGSSYVAMELVKVCQQIDACVDAVIRGGPLPAPNEIAPSIVNIAFSSMLLRADAQCDRNAVKPRYDTMDRRIGFDPNHRTARNPVRSMIEKIKDPEVAELARAAFGMDARIWFNRPASA